MLYYWILLEGGTRMDVSSELNEESEVKKEGTDSRESGLGV